MNIILYLCLFWQYFPIKWWLIINSKLYFSYYMFLRKCTYYISSPMYFHTVESWNIQIDLGPLDPASCQGTAHALPSSTKTSNLLCNLVDKKKSCDCGRIFPDKNMHWIFLDAHTASMDLEEHPNTCHGHGRCWATRRAPLQLGLHSQA